MVRRSSVRRARSRQEFGANIRRWRRLNQWSASHLAERAAVTRDTLRDIENGTGSPGIEGVFAVLAALGLVDSVVQASDPYRSDAGRARIDDLLAKGGSL